MTKIIAFHGPAFSGKDTAALCIQESNKNVDILSFAKPLKEACKLLFNFSNDQMYHPIIKEELDERWKKSPREILQWLGTDILRTYINKEFFVMNMKQRIDDSKADYIIIPDVRFDNEAEFIRSLGGKVIKIIRDNEKTGGKTTKHSGHSTEQGISANLIDAVIGNTGSIEEFQNTVRFVVEGVLFNSKKDFTTDDIDETHPRRFMWDENGTGEI